jgi:hypothetical protein
MPVFPLSMLGGGQEKPGFSDEEALFDEPAGISHAGGNLYVADTNNHAIRVVDLKDNSVKTLEIAALAPPKKPRVPKKPSFKGATEITVDSVQVKPVDGTITLSVALKLPKEWKINELAPMSYWIEATGDDGEAGSLERPFPSTKVKLEKPVASFEVPVKVTGEGKDTVVLSMNYYYCQKSDDGLCKIGSVVFTVPFEAANDAEKTVIPVSLDVKP